VEACVVVGVFEEVLTYPLFLWVWLGRGLGLLRRGIVVGFLGGLSGSVLVVLSTTQLITKYVANDSEKDGISEGHEGKDKYVLK
jgi:hypothetical protein